MHSGKIDLELMEARRELLSGEADLQSKELRSHKVAESYLAGVVGFPVQHSLSPYIFDWLSQSEGKKVAYFPVSIPPSSLSEDPTRLVWMLRVLPIVGVNVTIPYKEAVIKYLDSVSPAARAVGAINVIQKKGDSLIGHNTDVYGILASLEETGAAQEVKGKTTLLLGAGGAARAAAYVLGQLSAARVLVYNRTLSRAQRLCRDFGSLFPDTAYIPAEEGQIAPARSKDLSLIVQATPTGPLGMEQILASFGSTGGSIGSSLPVDTATQDPWAFDMVYRPSMTPFLEWARTQHMKPIHGLDMLIWQALATWEIWVEKSKDGFGKVKRQELKASLRADMEAYLKKTTPIIANHC